MTQIYFTEDIEIDWMERWGVYALNRESYLFEKVSDICADDKVIYYIDENYLNYRKITENDELNISEQVSWRIYNGDEIVYLLYSEIGNHLVGFVKFSCE